MPGSPLRAIVSAVFLLSVSSFAQPPAGPFAVSSARELDTGDLVAWSPKWSPDGKWIAFSLPKSEGVAITRANGDEIRVLTREPRSGYRFAWCPDGSRLAFRALQPAAGPRRYAICTTDLAGNVLEKSEVIPDIQPPQWETGAAGIRWVSHDGKRRTEGEWKASIAPHAAGATSPPLLVARGQQLWIEAVDRRPARQLTESPMIRPAWDRSGRRVLFDATDRIFTASTEDTETARQLCVGQHPAWSPHGEWIVYQITRDHSHAPGDDRQHTPDTLPHLHSDKTNHQIVDSDLWVIRRDGTHRHQITNTPDVLESDPDWAGDGKSIVCRDERTGRLRILEVRQQ